jgi:hypothetical protein
MQAGAALLEKPGSWCRFETPFSHFSLNLCGLAMIRYYAKTQRPLIYLALAWLTVELLMTLAVFGLAYLLFWGCTARWRTGRGRHSTPASGTPA